MNSFGCFAANMVKSSLNPNSITYINQGSSNITLDSSGTIAGNNLSSITGYSSTAWGINPTNGNTTFLSLKQNANNLTTPTSNFTFYIKHAERFYTDSIFGHGYTITSSASSVTAGNSFTVSFYSLYPTIFLPYTITGITSSYLSNASLTGNWTSNYQAITYTVATSTPRTRNFILQTGLKTLTVSLTNPNPTLPVFYFPFSTDVTNQGSASSTYLQTPSAATFTTIASKNCIRSLTGFQITNINYTNQNGYTIGFYLYLNSSNILSSMIFDFHDSASDATFIRFYGWINNGLLNIGFNGGPLATIDLSNNLQAWNSFVITTTTTSSTTMYFNGAKIFGPNSTAASIYRSNLYTRIGFFYDFYNGGATATSNEMYLANFLYYDKILSDTEIANYAITDL